VAFEEIVAMVRLAAREGSDFGIDPTRLAVGGDSAGANLALAAAVALRDAGERALGFMLLIYGWHRQLGIYISTESAMG
jgi:acetyl esterase